MKYLFVLLLVFTGLTATGQVAEKAEDISPLLISEKVPSLPITSTDGNTALLTDIVANKPAVLLFYRGGWCPYCNEHLMEVGRVEKEILELGFQLIGISPDAPPELDKTIGKGDLNYELYSDASGDLMNAMGIAFKAPERYEDRLFRVSDGKNSGLLPVPSMFVVDTDGTILFEYISPNYKQRISADLILAVLHDLNQQKG